MNPKTPAVGIGVLLGSAVSFILAHETLVYFGIRGSGYWVLGVCATLLGGLLSWIIADHKRFFAALKRAWQEMPKPAMPPKQYWGTAGSVIVADVAWVTTLVLLSRLLYGKSLTYETTFALDGPLIGWGLVGAVFGCFLLMAFFEKPFEKTSKTYLKDLRDVRQGMWVLALLGNPVVGPFTLLAVGLILLALGTLKLPLWGFKTLVFLLRWAGRFLQTFFSYAFSTTGAVAGSWGLIATAWAYFGGWNLLEGGFIGISCSMLAMLTNELITMGMKQYLEPKIAASPAKI